MVVYPTLEETLDRSKIKVLIPDNYTIKVPGYYLAHPEFTPFYEPTESFSHSQMTIKQICIMCTENIEFEIVDKQEIVIICNVLTRYIDECKDAMKNIDDTDIDKILFNTYVAGLRTLERTGEINHHRFTKDLTTKVTEKIGDLRQLFGGF